MIIIFELTNLFIDMLMPFYKDSYIFIQIYVVKENEVNYN